MNHAPIITGHDHFKAAELPAPLEFDLTPGDAELLATVDAAIGDLKAKNAPRPLASLKSALEAEGFTFVDGES